jgi:hypothetical protein
MTETTKTSKAMAHITMRIPVETLEFFQQFENPRTFMREVLDAHATGRRVVEAQLKKND